ncbi:unnamed protein product [Paramecium primaurelia]|uniref:Uncharacterized protein n=1 Tax=Paramecium primaurelia TaxID=5886 RepID=A0A8S1P052_PARPR|nr:unnamed protein product [Paramecium primaurelia]
MGKLTKVLQSKLLRGRNRENIISKFLTISIHDSYFK